jgi:hypothetical protein
VESGTLGNAANREQQEQSATLPWSGLDERYDQGLHHQAMMPTAKRAGTLNRDTFIKAETCRLQTAHGAGGAGGTY